MPRFDATVHLTVNVRLEAASEESAVRRATRRVANAIIAYNEIEDERASREGGERDYLYTPHIDEIELRRR